jgi:diguanylate cyclase (GGDEF)-like protein
MWIHGPKAPVEPRFAALRTGFARLRPRAWLAFLVGGLGLALAGALVGDEKALQPLVIAMGLAATAAILVGVRIHHPARHLPWQLVAVCTVLTTIGIGVIPKTGALGVLGQALTSAGYVAGFSGFVMLIRGRIPGGERAAFLDAAILASGTAVLIWAFGFAPYVLAARQDSVVTAAFFYPALVASAVVARMWFLGGKHRPATRLLVLLVLATDAITILDMLRGGIGYGALPGPFLLAEFASLAFVGAAALHPSMAMAPERQSVVHGPFSRHRLVALLAALLVNPATLAIEVWDGHQIDPAPYLIGGALIGVLVIARLGDALRQLGESLRDRESLMELLRRQALYDALTSLPNRSLFTERLAADFANRSADRPLAVLLVDLDDFKAVNDSYGHAAGDALLVAVGQRLRAAIRDGDTAARFGGDEFVIALPSFIDPLVPIRVAQRVLTTLGEPFDIGGHSLTVRASIGVAVAITDDQTADDLVRNADIAMYLAKSRGKGRIEVFEPSMQAAAVTQIQLRTDLELAIAGGDLRLHYQPVVDLRTGRTIGYEALVRWLRDGRLIAPGEFIPVAESSGLIGPLTDWVVHEACRTTASWGKAGDRPWVSVNLSSSQLVRQDIIARLGRTLEATGLAPDRLVIEITESSLLEIDIARPAIERLSEIGVRLAIDDFGTGYSALSYLARLPIDILKIDRSFVMALEQEGPEDAIAAAIIALAGRLGLTTIGEGIETAAQLDQLVALGCDLGQGFYLGRPAANEDLRPSPLPQGHRPRRTTVASLSA